MAKRWRVKKAKPGELIIYYGKSDPWDGPDVCYAWGEGARKSDGGLLADQFERIPTVLGQPLREILEERGYDMETIKFSIRLRANTRKGE